MTRQRFDADGPADLVACLGTDEWKTAYDRLDSRLETASAEETGALLDAVLGGFDHGNPQVRKWCVALMDHHATVSCIDALVGMLDDPRAAVRRHAVHSVGCQSCKDDPLELDVVELLVERIETDSSIRVRRAATHMLGNQPPDGRAATFLAELSKTADDEKLERNARWALEQHVSE